MPPMQPNQHIALWLHDEAAKLLLGRQGEGDRPASRWVAVATVLEMQSPIGVWVDVSFIEERKPGSRSKTRGGAEGKVVRWGIKPGQCLIRWEYIISAQNLPKPEAPEDPGPMPGYL